tara:strand:- start:350 stop:595 length:246 start_codon:yes stop_codon:yes gene_type:complete
MCIFGQQAKGSTFTPAETKQVETVTDLPQASDLKATTGADLQLGSQSNKKKPVDQTGAPIEQGAAALAINPTQSTGINTAP